MSSNSMVVRHLLEVLVSKIESCEENLTAQAVGNALYGLQVYIVYRISLMYSPIIYFLSTFCLYSMTTPQMQVLIFSCH